MKYSLVQGNVAWSQGTIHLDRGDSADDDHPLVLERPDLFGDEPPEAKFAGPARTVERATAAPGEKRDNPRKAAAKTVAKSDAKGGSSE